MGWWLTWTALLAGVPAAAEWRQARTDHFVLTIDDSEVNARDFADRLERFDAALRRLYGVADSADRRARPIAIYALKPNLFVDSCNCDGVLGFYRPLATGSFIVSAHLPGMDARSKVGGWSSQTVLLHEYSHHFSYVNLPSVYPFWYREGFAEFNANAIFQTDGSVVIGYPANYRAEGLQSGTKLSPRKLFDPYQFGFADPDLLYGRGWLLTHYLMLAPDRRGQLGIYLAALNRGQASVPAAQAAFGDIDVLNRALDAYAKGSLAPPLRIPPAAAAPMVTVTTLGPGLADMLPVHLQDMIGVREAARGGVASRAARIAARYPQDAAVQAQWAVAEISAKHYDRADAAADAALALQPGSIDALLVKGAAAIARAKAAYATEAAVWTAARGWLVRANRADPQAVTPLLMFYGSFVAAHQTPSAGAIRGLQRAAALAPESNDIRFALARQMLVDNDGVTARVLLAPIAFAPHIRSGDKNPARRMIEMIDVGHVAEARAAMLALDDDDAKSSD